MCLNSVTTCAGSTTGLAANGNGTLLYEASYGSPGCVSSFTPSGPPDYLTPYNANTSDSNSHDVALGICAPGTSCGYGGNMLTSDFSAENAYVVNEYMPTPLHQPLLLLEPPPPFIPPYPSNCANFGPAWGPFVGPTCREWPLMAREISGSIKQKLTGMTARLSLPQAALAALHRQVRFSSAL